LPLRPHTLISLWDMIRFFEDNAQRAVSNLENGLLYVKSIKIQNAAEVFSRKQNKRVGQMVDKSYFLSQRLNLSDSFKRSAAILTKLQKVGRNASEVYADLEGLFNSFMADLCAIECAYIPKDKIEWFESEKLFGDSVFVEFPDARGEIKSAGNCLALDLNTAAVFHLMRVVELGLRELAVRLKTKSLIKITKQTKKRVIIPIELGTWDEIIGELEGKLAVLRGITRSKRREAKIEFCIELLKELRHMKDLWRNKVMHTRATYDEKQAESAFNHVRAFMQKLAEKF